MSDLERRSPVPSAVVPSSPVRVEIRFRRTMRPPSDESLSRRRGASESEAGVKGGIGQAAIEVAQGGMGVMLHRRHDAPMMRQVKAHGGRLPEQYGAAQRVHVGVF